MFLTRSSPKIIAWTMFAAAAVFWVTGCATRGTSRYFSSIQSAVPAIDRLLREENWSELARYYDLSGTSIQRSSLESGEFFIRNERPEVAHPGGSWRYRHPFAPGWKFSGTNAMPEVGVVEVVMSIAIDQGDGRVQRGTTAFYMRESPGGWQILPPRN